MQRKKSIKRQHWMSDATLQLVEERRALKNQVYLPGNAEKIVLLNHEIQTMCRSDNKHL